MNHRNTTTSIAISLIILFFATVHGAYAHENTEECKQECIEGLAACITTLSKCIAFENKCVDSCFLPSCRQRCDELFDCEQLNDCRMWEGCGEYCEELYKEDDDDSSRAQ